jgi:hypothetical protein
MPLKVISVILGIDFAIFSLKFIPLEKIPFMRELFNYIDYDQSDEYLHEIGLTSGSAILNCIPHMLII